MLAGLNFAALFLGPELSYTGKLLYAYVTYLVFGITFDLVDIPYSSLMVTMTQNTHERNKLNSLVAIGLIIGTGLAVVGTVPLVGLFPTPQQGYRAVGAGLWPHRPDWRGGQRRHGRERVAADPDQSYTLRQLYPILIQNKPFMILMVSTVLFSIGNFVVTSANVIFTPTLWAAPICSARCSWRPARRFCWRRLGCPTWGGRLGKRNTYMLGFSLTIIIGVLFFILGPTSLPLLIALAAGMAVAGSPGAALIDSMVADTNEYAEWQTGTRSEGAIQAGFTFVKKTANGLGGALAGYMLAWVGYQTNAAKSPQTLSGLLAMVSLVPAGFAVLAMIAMYFYPLTEAKFEALLLELQGRKTAVLAGSD
ncbi:MAG: MFS transporter [Chloroflexi bacterium]|nr:MFS transporter [Chloroflexota bacterium]